jgi:hypothetical protein
VCTLSLTTAHTQFADFDKQGALDRDEFMVAMFLVEECQAGKPLPVNAARCNVYAEHACVCTGLIACIAGASVATHQHGQLESIRMKKLSLNPQANDPTKTLIRFRQATSCCALLSRKV